MTEENGMKKFQEWGLNLTPLDIHNQEFTYSFRGFHPDEVNAYLDEIIKDYQTFARIITELEQQIKELSHKEETPSGWTGESAAINLNRIQERLHKLEMHCFGVTRD